MCNGEANSERHQRQGKAHDCRPPAKQGDAPASQQPQHREHEQKCSVFGQDRQYQHWSDRERRPRTLTRTGVDGNRGGERNEEQAHGVVCRQSPEEQDHSGRGVGGCGEDRGGPFEELLRHDADERRHAQHASETEAACERQAAGQIEEPANYRIYMGVA
jgi:hypothetical protein